MTFTDAQIIDLDAGQRADRFEFRLLNQDRSALGANLDVQADQNPSVQVNTQQTSFRTATNIVVQRPPDDLLLTRLRVQPVMTLANGSEYALGVLMFGTDARAQYSAGELWRPKLFDENFLLDLPLSASWRLNAGDSVRGLFAQMAGEVLDPLGIPTDYSRVPDVAAANDRFFKVGTSRLTSLNELASLLAAFPPYFANSGAHTLKPAPVAGAQPDHVYAFGTRIFDGTAETTSSLYKAPNQYIVVGDGDVPVRGIYNLPADAPHSYFQTGQIIPSSRTVSGVTSQALAEQIAYVDALTDQTTYGTVAWGAAADPRHDIFDTATLLEVLYLETQWSLPFVCGGEHTHGGTRMWG